MSSTINQGASGVTQNPAYTGPNKASAGGPPSINKGKFIDDPIQVSQKLSKYSLIIMGILLVLMILVGVCLFFMYDFSNKFYKIVSSGQDSLCNFYTCSGQGDCNNLPKIQLPDGSYVCAPT